MKSVKKLLLASLAAILSILAYVASVLELLRITLRRILELPSVILLAGSALLAACCSIGFLIQDWSLAEKLLSAVFICLVIFVVSSIAMAILGRVLALIATLLDYLRFDKAAEFLHRYLENTVIAYGILLPVGPASKRDRYILFGIPFLIHWICCGFKKLFAVSHYIIAPVLAGAALLYTHHLVYEGDCSDYALSDHLICWFVIVFVAAFSFFIGLCLLDSIAEGVESADRLNSFFGTYSNLFHYWDQNSHYDHQSYEDEDDAPNETNPYYEVLGAAQTEEELSRIYHRLAREVHPDSPTGSHHEAAMLNEAYTYFRDEFKKNKKK